MKKEEQCMRETEKREREREEKVMYLNIIMNTHNVKKAD